MKIAMLSAFYPYRGGIAQFGAKLYRALAVNNDVEAYTFKRQYPDFLFPGKTQYVTEEDNADPIQAARLLDSMNPFSYRKTAKAIDDKHPDLFISQYWMTLLGPSFTGVHKRIKSKPRIAILHNVVPHEKRFFDRWVTTRYLDNNEGFVVMSDAVMKDLLELRPNAKYLRIDHPVYDQFGERIPRALACEKLNLPADRKYFLFFGFIRDYKGLDLLIDAMKSLEPGIDLVIAGECYGSFDKYQKQIEEAGLANRIHVFNQYINDAAVSPYFSLAEACVLPYKSATQSGITAIAHHFNVPVIATDVGGLKETIIHGQNGFIVSEADSKYLSETMSLFIENDCFSAFSEQLQNEKGEKTWENFAESIINFSKELL